MGLNPWLAMWSQPRTTIRAIVSSRPFYGRFWLPTIYALQALFFLANWHSLGLRFSFEAIVLSTFLIAPILGQVWLYTFGAGFYLSGKLLGGSAPFSHVCSALAWSHIPSCITLALWTVLLFNQTDTTFVLTIGQTETLFISFISLVVVVWVTVLIIRAFAEIQGFSILKASVNVAIVTFMYLLISFLFAK